MRKIEREVVGAFVQGRAKKVGNTESTGTQLYLHNNLIAERIQPDLPLVYKYRVTLAGWNTPTTRSRLNALLQLIGAKGRFSQRDYAPYYDGRHIGVADWIEV